MKLLVLGQASEIHGAFIRDDGIDAHVVRFEFELEVAIHAECVVFHKGGKVVVDVTSPR
jgi:hypothetical protein